MRDRHHVVKTNQPDVGSPVIDDISTHRFLLELDGSEAELVYRRNPRRLVLVHTGVPSQIAGRGVGGRLVEAALDLARGEGLTVVPVCPYARQWLEDHPQAAADVRIEWPHSDTEHPSGPVTGRPGGD